MARSADLDELKARLVDGIQVLTNEGVLDGSGHLSARVPGTETFIINPRYAGVLADPEDICVVDVNTGRRVAGEGPIPLETPIHTAVYRARPDVGSVLHSHPRYGVMLGVLDVGIVPFSRELRAFEGMQTFPFSQGIQDDELAGRMADALADRYALFLKGHGIVVSEPSIEATCIRATRLERACADQLFMMSFTRPRPLETEDAGAGGQGLSGPRLENPYRAWPFFLHKHGLRSREYIQNMARSGSKRTLREGETG